MAVPLNDTVFLQMKLSYQESFFSFAQVHLVELNDYFKDSLRQRKKVLDAFPFEISRPVDILRDKVKISQVHDVVCDVIYETATSRYNFKD